MVRMACNFFCNVLRSVRWNCVSAPLPPTYTHYLASFDMFFRVNSPRCIAHAKRFSFDRCQARKRTRVFECAQPFTWNGAQDVYGTIYNKGAKIHTNQITELLFQTSRTTATTTTTKYQAKTNERAKSRNGLKFLLSYSSVIYRINLHGTR